jgi:hypothetical protein
MTPSEAQSVLCPVCQARPGHPCTQPTDTGRRNVGWVHKTREFAWRSTQRQDFFLTFGIEYNDKPHPHWPECNPKGWVRITAATYEQARDMAKARFGLDWSQLTPAANFNTRYYPAGELMVLP